MLVPIGHVHIRAVRLQPVVEKPNVGSKQKEVPAPVLAPAPPEEAQKREAELAERVGKQLAIAEKAYKEGSYSDVPAVLDKVLTDEDPLGTQDFATHRLPLRDAPSAYASFQKKEHGMVKVLLKP